MLTEWEESDFELTTFKCAVCATESDLFNGFLGSLVHDLDGRPVGDARIINFRSDVKKCPKCGYCSPAIDRVSTIARDLINTESYKAQLADNRYPQKANDFICQGIIQEKEGALFAAGMSYLYAAWCCDDAENLLLAKTCRQRSLSLFELAETSGAKCPIESDLYLQILVDMLRKTEEFQKAEKLAKSRLKIERSKRLRRILSCQLQFCENGDTKTYNTKETDIIYDDCFFSVDLEDDIEEDFETESGSNNNRDRDYFDAMTDGQFGDHDDFKEKGGDIDDIDALKGN